MKKVLNIILSIIFIFLFSFYSFAANYNVYGSVTESTSQISTLIQTLFNQPDFDPFKDWIALRSDQYDYSLFYNIDSSGSCQRLRYYGSSSGYNTVWYFSHTSESNFTYNSNNYTVVGTQAATLGSQQYRNYLHQYIIKYTVPFILILFIIFIFRIRKRGATIQL